VVPEVLHRFDFIDKFDSLIDECRKRVDPEVPKSGVVYAYFEVVGNKWTLVDCPTQGRYVDSTNDYAGRVWRHDLEYGSIRGNVCFTNNAVIF
jgi:hypothetical protein